MFSVLLSLALGAATVFGLAGVTHTSVSDYVSDAVTGGAQLIRAASVPSPSLGGQSKAPLSAPNSRQPAPRVPAAATTRQTLLPSQKRPLIWGPPYTGPAPQTSAEYYAAQRARLDEADAELQQMRAELERSE